MNDLLEKALLLGQNKKIATEEFLVASSEKEAASFKVAPENISISNISEDTVVKLNMKIANEGYFEIEALAADDFVALGKRIITADDFIGGVYYFPVTIIEEKLHAGKNYSEIILRSSTQEIKIPVLVNIKVRSGIGDFNTKRLYANLMRIYIQYKKGLIDPFEWLGKSNDLIGEVSGNDTGSMFLMLYQAHMYTQLSQFTDAANILEFMAQQISKLTYTDYELFCYFYYVECMYERDEAQIEEAVKRVKYAYKEYPSWKVLWILINLDKSYAGQIGLKLDAIYDCFLEGCTSPIMYLEALEIFKKNSNFLCDGSNFEMQVLFFGAKNDYLNASISTRFAEIILEFNEKGLKRINIRLAIKILKIMYERFPNRSILKALCIVLIADENVDKENSAYYLEAIREYLDTIPGIYNYYFQSIDKTKYEEIPMKIVEYFFENTDTLGSYQSYVFANLVANKTKFPDYYKSNLGAMIHFAERQVSRGIVDEHLIVIYRDILATNLLTATIQRGLFEILATNKIICKSKKMTNVLIVHEELSTYQDVLLNNGEAYIKLYSGNALVLFKDARGNVYSNVEYEKDELIGLKEYVDLCIKGVPFNDYMLMQDMLLMTRAYKDPVEILHYLNHNINVSEFRLSYLQKIINDTVVYFSRNSKEQEVYDELIGFFKFDLAPETRAKLIEIMIERTLYRDAFEEIKKGGFENINPESVAKLAHVMAEMDDNASDELILSMCEYSFVRTGFDKIIFSYLLKNYNDKLGVMLDLYRASNAYGIEDDSLPERILRRTIETHESPEIVPQLFANYYEHGSDEQLKKDYLNYMASRYFYDKDEKNDEFFTFVEMGLINRVNYNLVTEIAYLKYMSDKDISSSRRIKMIEEKIKNLTSRAIMIEEFKAYNKYFELPSALANSVIITSVGHKSTVTYTIENGEDSETKSETMREIMDGLYAKYITLFYGESVTYSVDDGESKTIKYDDLDIVHDESKYSSIDNLIRLESEENFEELDLQARAYFVKSRLIDRLF